MWLALRLILRQRPACRLVDTPSGRPCRSFSIPFSWRKTQGDVAASYFKNRFAQTAPKDQADALYDRYIVPTPGKVYWDGVINTLKIDWKNPEARTAAFDCG